MPSYAKQSNVHLCFVLIPEEMTCGLCSTSDYNMVDNIELLVHNHWQLLLQQLQC
jgi:hypothetical protein